MVFSFQRIQGRNPSEVPPPRTRQAGGLQSTAEGRKLWSGPQQSKIPHHWVHDPAEGRRSSPEPSLYAWSGSHEDLATAPALQAAVY